MKNLLIYVLVAVLLTSCFAKREEVIQKESISYIVFMGNLDKKTFTLEQKGEPHYLNIPIEPKKAYSVKPGNYEIKVYQENQLIVHRKLFLTDGQTREVLVP